MRLRTRPYLSKATVARARALRREMTEAELALWRGLRESLPQARFRCQVPLGSYYADFASHRCRLIVEVDGSQHGEALDYDATRTRFLESEGYRVLRFWNNEVLRNLDGVLTAIASQIPSPLVGEGGAKRRMGGARRSRASAKADTPTTRPPHKGEEAKRQPSVGVR